jgi:hypothetical protein
MMLGPFQSKRPVDGKAWRKKNPGCVWGIVNLSVAQKVEELVGKR